MNAVHAFGNGHIIGYCRGADIFELLCPNYSAPSMCGIYTTDKNNYKTVRHSLSDIYTHTSESGSICDVVLPGKPIFLRRITGTASFVIKIPAYASVCDVSAYYGRITLQIKIKQGTPVYNTYPAPCFINCALILRGITDYIMNGNDINVSVSDGYIIAAGGKTYPEFIDNMQYSCSLDFDKVKAERESDWKAFFGKTINFDFLPENIPMRSELLNTIESVKIADRVQQDASGGEIAGYPYHLGYVRDNYGVMRGMLALGMYDEAERILLYFNNEFKHTGCVANAQGLGFFGIKHIHENDCSEITGYLLLMLSDILRHIPAEKHYSLTAETLPMLEWAIKEQCSGVIDGMLPFNGDETYIAGGILPRNVINHGSSEATLLFIEGSKRLFCIIDRLGLSFNGDRKYYESKVAECERLYRRNFIFNGSLITNNPNREINNPADMPRFRHGVCEGYCGHFGWNERMHSLYLCPDCQMKEIESGIFPQPNHNIYNLKPVLLMPVFINSNIINISDIKKGIGEAADTFDKEGTLPSHPDGSRCLGYDYGLLLGALNSIGGYEKTAEKLYCLALSVTDETCIWSEYYENNIPSGTLYRPWESSINIEALIKYAKTINHL